MVTLDQWDSHLDLRVSEDGMNAHCLHKDGMQYLWKGARATHGVIGGCFYFEVKVIKNLNVDMPDTAPKHQNIVRIGASLPLSSLFCGDSAESWGWGGTGKKSHNAEFEDFGGSFSAGDVIGCIMDVDNLTISFTKNGRFQGIAFSNISAAARTQGLFPHLLLKNVEVQVNFGRLNSWFPPPSNVYFLEEATSHFMTDNPIDHPRRIEEAEFIMMVGLPACGKTYWAQKHMEENPRKNYCLLGTNTIIDQMKVSGLLRKANYAERWQELITMATPVFNKMCEIASNSTRHIILDQTNVFPKARGRKVQEYRKFGQRRAVVILNDDDTLQERTEKREREEGKFVPLDAVMGMKQNFTKPHLDEGFTHIDYVEIPEHDAKHMIKKFNDQGWDFKRRNGGGNKSARPNKPLDQRSEKEINFDRRGYRDTRESKRIRSRSPRKY